MKDLVFVPERGKRGCDLRLVIIVGRSAMGTHFWALIHEDRILEHTVRVVPRIYAFDAGIRITPWGYFHRVIWSRMLAIQSSIGKAASSDGSPVIMIILSLCRIHGSCPPGFSSYPAIPEDRVKPRRDPLRAIYQL